MIFSAYLNLIIIMPPMSSSNIRKLILALSSRVILSQNYSVGIIIQLGTTIAAVFTKQEYGSLALLATVLANEKSSRSWPGSNQLLFVYKA